MYDYSFLMVVNVSFCIKKSGKMKQATDPPFFQGKCFCSFKIQFSDY